MFSLSLSLCRSGLCLTFLAGTLLSVAVSGDTQPLTIQPVNGDYHLQGKRVAVDIRIDHGSFAGLHVTDLLSSRSVDLPQAFAL